jgi:hypothetical protein
LCLSKKIFAVKLPTNELNIVFLQSTLTGVLTFLINPGLERGPVMRHDVLVGIEILNVIVHIVMRTKMPPEALN